MRISGETILLVEDEPLHGAVLEVALIEDGGFKIVLAASAAEALNVLNFRNDISVVLSDQNMPGAMDGLALIHSVSRSWPGMMLILMSGSPPRAHLPLGARFVFKPTNNDDLIDLINDMLVRRPSPPTAPELGG